MGACERMRAPKTAPMRGVIVATVLSALVGGVAASAQETRKYELSAEYAYLRAESSAGGLSLHGVSFSLARNLNKWLAVVGDGGGYHLEGFRLGTVQAGVRFTAQAGRRTYVYSQALLGFAHANAGGRGFPTYHESVAWTAGGGFDYRVSERISLRLVQMEYVQTRLGNQVQHNLRAGTGIVFHFGGRPERRFN
jgi:hypothetical protein